MITIHTVDTQNKYEVEKFIRLPYRLYKGHPQWVPPLLTDMRLYLNKNKHPFFQHSEAEFFYATQDNEIVGRLAVLENKRFNEYHGKNDCQFYFFDSIK